jgi:hypothetical protein
VTATVSCPAGKVLLGGGGQAVNSDSTHPERVLLRANRPTSTNDGWTATAVATTNLGSGFVMTVTAYAICTA